MSCSNCETIQEGEGVPGISRTSLQIVACEEHLEKILHYAQEYTPDNCTDCNQAKIEPEYFPYRVEKATVEIHGCREHAKNVMNAMNKGEIE